MLGAPPDRLLVPIVQVIAGLVVMGAVPLIAAEPEFAIVGVNVVDVSSGRILPNTTVTIGGNTIVGIDSDVDPKAGTARVE